ncbi:MAG: hypothetical protein WB053_06505 [Nitrososphaeraceae archaeon]
MAIKYSSVPDSLFTNVEGNGIEFKDSDYSAWQSTRISGGLMGSINV